MVNSEHKVIAAVRATNQPSDKQQAVSMVEEATVNAGELPGELSADAATTRPKRWTSSALWELTRSSRRRGSTMERGRSHRPGAGYPRVSPRDRKLRTKRGRERYALRMEMETVEAVFGQIMYRVVVSGSSCCEAWRRSTGNGI